MEQASQFKCAMCGNCCRIDGFVRITLQECATVAAYLGVPAEVFVRDYTRTPDVAEHAAAGDLWLKDNSVTGACCMLSENLCSINPVKPESCRGFPLRWRTPEFLDYCLGMRS